MTNNEQQINNALNSLNGLQRAKAPQHLYDSVLQNAASGKLVQMPARQIRPVVYLRIAACVILLAGINVFTLVNVHKKQQETTYNSSAFAGEYFSFLKNI